MKIHQIILVCILLLLGINSYAQKGRDNFKSIFGSAPKYSRDSLVQIPIKDNRLLGKWEFVKSQITIKKEIYVLTDTADNISDSHFYQLLQDRKMNPIILRQDTTVYKYYNPFFEFKLDHTFYVATVNRDTSWHLQFWVSKGKKDSISIYNIVNDSIVSGGHPLYYYINARNQLIFENQKITMEKGEVGIRTLKTKEKIIFKRSKKGYLNTISIK
jgi:hypothetical protein